MSTATPSNPPETPERPERPEPRASDEPLTTAHAFRRFVDRVSLCAGRWLTRWGVPHVDRDDVFQDALLRMYQQRELYNPALGDWERWAFSYVYRVVCNYRSRRANRIKREDTTLDVFPDMASNAPSPEEETATAMMKALKDKCMADLDDDSRAILHASAEGIKVSDIATAYSLSIPGAYARLTAARARMQAALDREQRRKVALGVAVLPISIEQLLASDTTTSHFSPETMRQVWKTLDRVMSADIAAGKLRDDGTVVERYMGSPNAAPRAGLGARILHKLGPRALSALTHVAAAAVGAVVTYAPIAHGPTQKETTAEARAAASSMVAHVEYSRGPAPTGTAATRAGVSGLPKLPEVPELPELPELRAVELSADAGAGPSDAGRDDVAEEQSLFDHGSTAFQTGSYEDAIQVLQEHANKYPRGPYSAARERLLTLALIRSGRTPEARQRIDRIRQASPGSALLAEFDAAMTATSP
jgi:RNA polymerase sigma factor (sigma-70 family)